MIDKKDLKILEILKREGRISAQQLSAKTGIPATTVHYRTRHLEKIGIIKGYTTVLDGKKLGKTISAYILATVDYKLLKQRVLTQHKLAEELSRHRFVESTAMVTGTSDIVLKVSVSSIDQLDEFVTKYMRNIDGIEKTQTMVILSEFWH